MDPVSCTISGVGRARRAAGASLACLGSAPCWLAGHAGGGLSSAEPMTEASTCYVATDETEVGHRRPRLWSDAPCARERYGCPRATRRAGGCGLFSDPAAEDDGPDATPASASASDIEKWERNAEREERPYLNSAGVIDPGLVDAAALGIGVDLCRHLFRTETDEMLVDFVVEQVRVQLEVELTAEEAAQFVVATNDHVCPDLAR